MGLAEKLMQIQTKIKVPKNLHNKFGDFNYRNAESICEAVKPFLKEENVTLTLSDEIVEIGGRIYVKAIAQLSDIETNAIYEVSAYAREALEKKGMDEAQITGAASSYARKYALNGLFLLDDTKDSDSDEYRNQAESVEEEQGTDAKAEKESVELASQAQKNCIFALCKKHGIDVKKLYASNGLDEKEVTKSEATSLINSIKRKYGDD